MVQIAISTLFHIEFLLMKKNSDQTNSNFWILSNRTRTRTFITEPEPNSNRTFQQQKNTLLPCPFDFQYFHGQKLRKKFEMQICAPIFQIFPKKVSFSVQLWTIYQSFLAAP